MGNSNVVVNQQVGITPNGNLVLLTPLYMKYTLKADNSYTVLLDETTSEPVVWAMEHNDSGEVFILNSIDQIDVLGDI